MVWGCISAYRMGSLHVLEGTINAERYKKALEQHTLPSKGRLLQGMPCVFQQDNAKPHIAAITTQHGFFRDDVKVEYMSKTTTNSTAAGKLYPNSNTKNSRNS